WVRDRTVSGRKRIQKERKIVDQRVVDSESGTYRRPAVSKRIPGERGSRAEQPLRLVFREYRVSNARVRQKRSISASDVVGSPSELLIPTVCEFVSKADAERQVAPQLHGIFGVPCSEPTSETQLRGRRHDLESRRAKRSLQEGRQAGEIRDSQSARSRIFIVLQFLEPCAHTDLMNSTAHLQVVC